MDFSLLFNDKNNLLEINKKINIPIDYYKDTEIVKLEPIAIKGYAKYVDEEEIILYLESTGVMVIPDSITLDNVNYKFSFKIEENVYEKIEKNQFRLDIIELLWENIVLEIPIRYSEVDSYDGLSGDGWKVISENDLTNKTNNPFKELLNLEKKE